MAAVQVSVLRTQAERQMHHIYAGGKGDPLCPLGFHPQVRWPTRCKRCFRDYKEHGGKGTSQDLVLSKEDKTKSTPSLSWTPTPPRTREDGKTHSKDSAFANGGRLSPLNSSSNKSLSSSSWTSTPDLGNVNDEVYTSISVTLPRRRVTADLSSRTDDLNRSTEFTVKRPTFTTDANKVKLQNDTPSKEKKLRSLNFSEDQNKLKMMNSKNKIPSVATDKSSFDRMGAEAKSGNGNGKSEETEIKHDYHINPDVEFILRVKSSKPEAQKKTVVRQSSSVLVPPHVGGSSSSSGTEDSYEEEDDNMSTTGTETTETTLVGKNDSELLEEVESLKNELEAMKARCEKAEREKSDILLRRLASFDTSSTKTAASEVLKLQQKVNELSAHSEDLKDDNKSLSLRVKELEKELKEDTKSGRNTKKVEELQAKLAVAETLCEELMDENEEMKKELRELEDEIEEMQDNFREDQADEYSSLKKELEQTTKNCRILSFKLRKSERRTEQLETEKMEIEMKYKEMLEQKGGSGAENVKKIEGDLKTANELAARLTRDLEEANKRLKILDNKNDTLRSDQAVSGRSLKPAGGEKVSRASLTRGGSQEDSQQLLRDLQDSLERETDLREQLRFAEEEAASLRKKAARIEEDNDSLALQLKKMATKAKTSRRSTPSASRRVQKNATENSGGTSDEDDPAELRLLLELNEQESGILRKKVEDLENDSEVYKKKIKELDHKLASCSSARKAKQSGCSASLPDKEEIKYTAEEIREMREKMLDKEKEVEKLQKEIELSHEKTARGQLVKSQSLDSPAEEKAVDLRKQLQLVEQEATVLRTKIFTLEVENEKLIAENKKLHLLRGAKKAIAPNESSDFSLPNPISEKQVRESKEKSEKLESKDKKVSEQSNGKISEADDLRKELKQKSDELEKLKKECASTEETLKRLREGASVDAVEYYKSRKPKKPTDFTTKLQLKKMVEDLENEICDILVILKKSASENSSAKPEAEEKEKLKVNGKMKDAIVKLQEEKKKAEETAKILEQEKNLWETEKQNLTAQVDRLRLEKKSYQSVEKEISVISKKLEFSNKELEEEKKNVKKLKKEVENTEKLEVERGKLEKDVISKKQEIESLKMKLAESEGKIKKSLDDLEEAERRKEKKLKTTDDELTEVRKTNKLLNSKIADLEKDLSESRDVIRRLEESIRKERERATDECVKAGSTEKKEITALRDDLSQKAKQLDDLNKKLKESEKEKRAADEKHKMAEAEMQKERNSWESKTSELEKNLNAERKKSERMKTINEKEQKNREMELSTLKTKIRSLEHMVEASSKVKDEHAAKSEKLEEELEREKRRYDDLTGKYELLEEEHVVTKARLVLEKENAQNQMEIVKEEMTSLGAELKELKDTLASSQEAWSKEKKDLQEKATGTSEKAIKASQAKWEVERMNMQAINDEQKSLVDQLKQQNEAMMEQMEHMRKENEDLRKKLDDFDKVTKIQRQMSAGTNQLEIQLREIRGKLMADEKSHKSELAALKLRYESRVNLIIEELQASQSYLSRLKKERDTYKHMLEEAQIQMVELKKGSSSDVSGELNDKRTAMSMLEQQVSCMEDELSESRLECSKLKTELVSQKSAWEVKLSELQSRVNEVSMDQTCDLPNRLQLEEEKILSSGRTKVFGLRTKMELAWQKEREDQQRLLQETSTLARDLRQTLYEVERERDKERLESKRRQDQLKKASEEEMEENRKKITELQYDLLELRDAHAKLRTTNEKLRKEKERWDRENRLTQRSKIKAEDEGRKFQVLLDNIDLLMKASFEKKNSGKFVESFSKKRVHRPQGGSKSKESSPMASPQDEIQLILQRLNETAEDIRVRMQPDERSDERSRRASSVGHRSLRAASAESDSVSESSATSRRPIRIQRKNTLCRKSLSLSETIGRGTNDQVIWRDDDDVSSTSLDYVASRLKNPGLQDGSMDSRLSGGSTQSEVLREDKKRKKGFLGKLKKLTKSRSVDDPASSQEDVLMGGESDSDVSFSSDARAGSRKDLKWKLADMFKKDSSRSNSEEQPKKSEERRSRMLPKHVSGISDSFESTGAGSTRGRSLDKTKNPAASLLKKP